MNKLFLTTVFLLLSLITFAQSKMLIFQGEIKNQNSDSIYFRKKDQSILKGVKIKEGVFKTVMNIKEGIYEIYDGKEYSNVFLKNGFDLKMTVDAKNFDNSIKYKGFGSKENNFLADKLRSKNEFTFDKLMNVSEDEFPKLMQRKNETELKLINDAKFDLKFSTILKDLKNQEFEQFNEFYNRKTALNKLNKKSLPNFDFINSNGGQTKLEDLKGKYLLIDIWATWCGSCAYEYPFLKKLEEKYKDKNIEFVSISVDDDKDIEKWRKMVKTKEMKGTQLHALNSWKSDFIKATLVSELPRFIIVDPNGIIINSSSEKPSNSLLSSTLDNLLN